MLDNSLFWALSPLADTTLASLPGNLKFEAGRTAYSPLPDTFAGPVADAERAGLPVQSRDNIAVISLRGIMLKSYPWASSYVASSLHVRLAVKAARLDASIDHIVLVADTPGGDVRGMHELGDEINAAATEKNVVVQVEGILASAGYYVAAGATAIYASHRMHSVGSIGVRTALWDSSKLYEEAGIKVIKIDTGEHKSTGMDGVPITEAQVAEVQRVVDQLYAEFLQVIQQGRGISEKDLKPLADGRTWFAHEALGLGLIDAIQPLETTMAGLSRRSQSKQGMTTQAAAEMFAEFDS
tara:strand:- start:18781 stop:19671 length:891 start_codon:yes stop_codon:yes gene_type:complete